MELLRQKTKHRKTKKNFPWCHRHSPKTGFSEDCLVAVEVLSEFVVPDLVVKRVAVGWLIGEETSGD
jgi:hypothetical protein